MSQRQVISWFHQLRRRLAPPPGLEAGDGQLLDRFVRGGDQAAFGELVRRHGPMVLGVCRRLLPEATDAEDAFQAAFLVLVRKAGSLHQYGSLANWLHTVAHRLALKMRTQVARRQTRERQVESMPETATSSPEGWAELRAVLDAELGHLPARYREPVILCYLEGRTNEEAAVQLGCPVGTVKVRLSRARGLLRDRLTRRGLGVGAALLTPALAERATAAVPAPLEETTIRVAGLFVAGQVAAAGAASLRAVALADGILKGMFMNRLKSVAVALLALGLVGTGTGVLLRSAPRTDEARGGRNLPVAVANADAAPAPPERVRERDQVRKLRQRLAEPVTLEKGIEADTKLKDALEILSKKYGVTFTIKDDAFRGLNLEADSLPNGGGEQGLKVEEAPVKLPRIAGVRLSTVLRRLLEQVRLSDGSTAAYLLRPDHIEVTTSHQQMSEVLGDDPTLDPFADGGFGPAIPPAPGEGSRENPFKGRRARALSAEEYFRRQTPVLQVDFDRRPLAEALEDLAAEAGIELLVDARVAERARTPVSLALNNVFFDTAVTLMTEMAELDWYWVDRVLYVTSKDNARAHKAKLKAIMDARIKAETQRAQATPDTSAQPQLVNVQCDKQPLTNVLKGLPGSNVVVDARVEAKATVPISANLTQVPVETAVRLLADMADLGVVRVDRAFYVTSKQNAKALAEQLPTQPAKAP